LLGHFILEYILLMRRGKNCSSAPFWYFRPENDPTSG
jgi:hypothetical protein